MIPNDVVDAMAKALDLVEVPGIVTDFGRKVFQSASLSASESRKQNKRRRLCGFHWRTSYVGRRSDQIAGQETGWVQCKPVEE